MSAPTDALRIALDHIEHMASWIGKQQPGYSFESLGEDMPGMRSALIAALGWKTMETAPKDGRIVNVVARYPEATAGFPRYAAYSIAHDAWVEYSRFEPQIVIPWAWRPRDAWPREPGEIT